MKRLFFIAILLTSNLIIVLGQTSKTDYFINTSTTRSLLNPALRPSQGYVGIPVLSNVYMDAKTNTLNLGHLTFEKNGKLLNFMHPDVSFDEFIKDMSKNNYLSMDMSMRILSGGWYSGDGFWSIDMGVRSHTDVNIPKSTFEFLKKGFSANPDDSFEYDLKNIGGNVSAFMETGVGYSKPFLDNSLMLGAKVKLLFGIGNMDFNIDRLNISFKDQIWKAQAKASINGTYSGLKPTYTTKTRYDENGDRYVEEQFDGFDADGFGMSGFGLGFDIGGVYDFKNMSKGIEDETLSNILSRSKVSMAFTDIGYISWSGKNSAQLRSPDLEVEITPDTEWGGEDKSFEDHLGDIGKDLEDIFNFKESKNGKGRTSGLRTNMNIGIEYEAWKDNLTVGLLSSTQFGAYHTTSELTLSANYNPNRDWFATSLSYSFVHGMFKTIGLAVHLAPKKGLNFFIASDYLIPEVNKEFIPVSSRSVNLQFGFTVPIGKRM